MGTNDWLGKINLRVLQSLVGGGGLGGLGWQWYSQGTYTSPLYMEPCTVSVSWILYGDHNNIIIVITGTVVKTQNYVAHLLAQSKQYK